MDFVTSPFGKMQLWIVEPFFLHKKVPVQMLWFAGKKQLLFETLGSYGPHAMNCVTDIGHRIMEASYPSVNYRNAHHLL